MFLVAEATELLRTTPRGRWLGEAHRGTSGGAGADNPAGTVISIAIFFGAPRAGAQLIWVLALAAANAFSS
jgi:hypothetical protein